MFIAMNRFKVAHGSEAEFETMWRNRDSHLCETPGFIGFHLLRGPRYDGYTLYASHSSWKSEEAFDNWTRSKAFRLAHKGAGEQRSLYLGPPVFEGFTVVETKTP